MSEASPACHPVGILSTPKAYENRALRLASIGHWQNSNCSLVKKVLNTNMILPAVEYLEEMNLGGFTQI